MAIFAFVATSCNKENIRTSKGGNITVKVNGIGSLNTKSAPAEAVVLKPISDSDAPSLYMVSSPYESDALSTKSAAITGSTLASFTLDAFVDGKSGKYLDKIEATYNSGDGKWTLGKNKDGKPCTWSWDAEKGKYSDIAFWAWACDESIGSIQDKLSDNSSSMSFSYSDFVQSKQGPYTKDLLVAYNKQNEGTVEFKFAHALAAVSAFVDPEQEPDAKIVDCSFNNVLSQGNCTCTPSGESVSFEWTGSAPKSYAASFEGTDALSQDNFHFIIPQSLGADATVTITVEKNGVKRIHTYSLDGTKWEAGKKYVYRLGYPTGAILMNGPDFLSTVNAMASNGSIESVEFRKESPISDYPSTWPRVQVQDPTSKAKIYAVHDVANKKLYVTTSVDNLYSNVSMERMFNGYQTCFSALKSITFGPLDTKNTTTLQSMFENCSVLSSVDLATLNTEHVTNFARAFFNCKGLSTIDLRAWDTSSAVYMEHMFDSSGISELLFDSEKFDVSKVRFMHFMFCNCPKLTQIDMRSWNTASLENTVSMFSGCSNIEYILLDPDKFTTGKVVRMSGMFSGCVALKSLDVTKFDLSKCEATNLMFYNCKSLTSLNVSSWTTSKVTEMQQMFEQCTSLTTLNTSNWTTSKVTNMQKMFDHCESMPKFDISKFSTEVLTNTASMFDNCKSATEITLDPAKFTCEKVTTMDCMFRSCEKLQSLDFSSVIGSNVTTTHCMFQDCKSLGTLDLRKFETAKVTNAAYMFQNCLVLNPLQVDNTKFTFEAATTLEHMFDNCKNLLTVDVTGFKTSHVTTMAYMFYLCLSMTTLDVTHFDTSSVTRMEDMFRQCVALQSLDVTHFNTENVTHMEYMFHYCNKLTTLDVTHFNTANVTQMEYMFENCKGLSSLDLRNFETAKVKNMSYMFDCCSYITAIQLDKSKFDTGNVTNMQYMFNACQQLGSLDVSGFNTSKVTNFLAMFSTCEKVPVLDVSNFDTSNGTSMNAMFQGCQALTSLDLSSFNTAKVTNMGNMFKLCVNLSSLTLGGNFKLASSKTAMMELCGRDIADGSGVLHCPLDIWNAMTAAGANTSIDTAKWNHVAL